MNTTVRCAATMRSQTQAEWEAMRAARAAMPSWMARAVSEVDFV